MNWLRWVSCCPFGTKVVVAISVPWAVAHGYIMSLVREWTPIAEKSNQFMQVDECLSESSAVVACTDFDQPIDFGGGVDRALGRLLQRTQVFAVNNNFHDAANTLRHFGFTTKPVSYTHLTLPTIYSV